MPEKRDITEKFSDKLDEMSLKAAAKGKEVSNDLKDIKERAVDKTQELSKKAEEKINELKDSFS